MSLFLSYRRIETFAGGNSVASFRYCFSLLNVLLQAAFIVLERNYGVGSLPQFACGKLVAEFVGRGGLQRKKFERHNGYSARPRFA